MAGNGPPPKDPKIRQRRNKKPSAAELPPEPPIPPKKKVPPLPTMRTAKKFRGWHPMTRAWWLDVWRSPMAAKFLTADIHGLYVLAELVDRFWAEPSAELAREIRLQRMVYGITPGDRARLQWSILESPVEAPSTSTPAPAPSPRPSPPPPAEDPRRVLAMVPRRA